MASVAAAALATAVACAPDGDASAMHSHQVTSATSFGQPDAVIAGPQGKTAQFVAKCAFDHAAQDDPIVHPGEPGASHLHVFFGNTDVDAFTVAADLPTGETTCDQPLDRAAYWAPALLRGNEVIEPIRGIAYYRPGVGVDPAVVEPYPVGLLMVGGNAGATEAQPVSIVAWTCGAGSTRSVTPVECTQERPLRLVITFPDCWDGEHLDSDDHHAHIAYSSGGECPGSHPVHIPQLQFEVEYRAWGPTDGLLLASGGVLTGHADFMNGWVQDKLETEVRSCLNRNIVCGLASGRADG